MNDISVILTVWKRDNLKEQLDAILNQTANINEIYVYQNESWVDISELKSKYNFTHIHSDKNFKFHGRFVLPLLFDTKYTAIFDDDTIPAKNWLSHCKELCDEKNCIVGSNYRNYNGNSGGLCDGKFNNKPVMGDIVGHCWFFKTKWIHHMWRNEAYTFENGEDIHFCASCKIYGGIDSYLPTQTKEEKHNWGDTNPVLGTDEHSTWKTHTHNSIRTELYHHWQKKGWICNQ